MVYNYENVYFGRKEKLKHSPLNPGYFHLQNIFRVLRNKPYKLLDVGCGQGAITKLVKEKYPKMTVYAIDPSEVSIKSAQENPESVNFQVANTYKIPYKSKTFDYVISLDVLEHLDDPIKGMSEVCRVLKKDGLLILSCDTEGVLWTLHGIIWKLIHTNFKRKYVGHVQMLDKKQVFQILEESGFRVLNYKWSNYWFHQSIDLFPFVLRSIRTEPVRKGKSETDESVFRSVGNLIHFVESSIFSYIGVPGQQLHIVAKII